MHTSDSASSSSPDEPSIHQDSVDASAALSHGNRVLAPTKNTLGTVAFVLAIVMLVVEFGFAMTVNFAAGNFSFEQLQTFFFVRAIIGLFLALLIVILATVSLLLKGRRKTFGALALGAGAYALLMTLFSFIGNAVAAILF